MNSKISLKNSGIQKTKINTSGILGAFEKQHTKIYSLNHKGMNLTSQNSRSNSKSKISINNTSVRVGRGCKTRCGTEKTGRERILYKN